MNVTKATCFFFFFSHIAFNYELLTCVRNLPNILDKQQGCTEGHVPQDISTSTTQYRKTLKISNISKRNSNTWYLFSDISVRYENLLGFFIGIQLNTFLMTSVFTKPRLYHQTFCGTSYFLLTMIICCSVITTHVYNDTKYSLPFMML